MGDARHDQAAPALLALYWVMIQGQPAGMWLQQVGIAAMGGGVMAGPWIVGRVGHHPGAHRVELDVTHAGQQVIVIADQAGLVTAFPQGAGAKVTVIDVAHIAPPQALHQNTCCPAALRGKQQVHVVGHQYPGMQPALVLQAQLTQVLQVAMVVGGVEEAGLAIIAPLHDVLGNAGQVDTGLAGHGDIRGG